MKQNVGVGAASAREKTLPTDLWVITKSSNSEFDLKTRKRRL
jgi:hypothetical protein